MTWQLPPEVSEAFIAQAGFDPAGRILHACYVGSTSHNTYVPNTDPDSIDDIDIMAIVVPPIEKVAGLHPWKETEQIQIGPWDVNVHSVAKYTRLLLNGNPNMLCTLWVRPEDRLVVGQSFMDLFLPNRRIFSTKRAYQAFYGYANEQLRKMTSANPYQGYMGAKRKKLVERFGYDTKNAAHMLRLLTMSAEFSATGEMKVFRDEDGQTFRDVKSGLWSLDRVQGRAAELYEAIKLADAASTLPMEADAAKAEELLLRVYARFWGSSLPNEGV